MLLLLSSLKEVLVILLADAEMMIELVNNVLWLWLLWCPPPPTPDSSNPRTRTAQNESVGNKAKAELLRK